MKKNHPNEFHWMRSRASVVTCFHRDYRDLAEIPVGKQPINPWARSSTNKMTTRNVFCRVLQPVPRIIDPRKICDSIEPVYLTWYFFPRFFFFFAFFFTSSRIRWTIPESLNREKQPIWTICDKPIGSNYKHCIAIHYLTLDLSVAREHTYTLLHSYTHIFTCTHNHIITYVHTYIQAQGSQACTNYLGQFIHTRNTQDITQTQVDNWPIFAIGVLAYRLPPKCLDQHTQTHLRKTLTRGMSRSTNRKLLVSVFEQ